MVDIYIPDPSDDAYVGMGTGNEPWYDHYENEDEDDYDEDDYDEDEDITDILNYGYINVKIH